MNGRSRIVPTVAVCLVWLVACGARVFTTTAGGAVEWLCGLAAFVAVLVLPGLQLERVLRVAGLCFHPLSAKPPVPRDWRTVARDRLPPRSPALGEILSERFGSHDALERSSAVPARAFALSVALVTLLGAIAAVSGLPISAAVIVVALVTIAFSLIPAPAVDREVWPVASQSKGGRGRKDAEAGRKDVRAAAPPERKPPAYIAFFQGAQTEESPQAEDLAQDSPPRSPSSPWRKLGFALVVLSTLAAMLMAIGGDNIARDRMWYMAYLTRLSEAESFSWAEPFFGSGRVLPRFLHNSWLTSLAAWKWLCGSRSPLVFEHFAPLVLIPLVMSATLGLARSLFGRCRTAVPTCATLLVVLSSRYPFFAPEHTLFHSRLAEDKTMALLVLMPVVLTVFVEWLTDRARSLSAPAGLLIFGLTLMALALAHAVVYLLVLIVTVSFGLYLALGPAQVDKRRVATALALAFLIALPPALLGLQAKSSLVPEARVSSVLEEHARHPVVRSHRRMERLLDIGTGGPIVAPRLLADPLLLLALAALPVAFVRRRSKWGAYLLAASLPCLLLAFTPYVAPAVGRLLLPWMTYRMLWGVPFGFLLAVLVTRAPRLVVSHGVSRLVALTLLVLLVVLTSWHRIPWQRLSPGAWGSSQARLTSDSELRGLLAEISRLPRDSVIAASRELSELIPAYSGRYVVAFSDRGTVVFTGSLAAAEQRLRAAAVMIGLTDASRELRDGMIGTFAVTHSVYEGRPCLPPAAPVYESERFVLCKEVPPEGDAHGLRRLPARAPLVPRGSLLASLEGGLQCAPAPQSDGDTGLHRWTREWRWTAKALSIVCAVRFAEAVKAKRLRIVANLPKARESILYRLEMITDEGKGVATEGALDFDENHPGEIELPGVAITTLRVHLVPAYLPYLNLRSLEVRGG